MYVWDWATPAFDGKFGAVHGHDVDASFAARKPVVIGEFVFAIRDPGILSAGCSGFPLVSRLQYRGYQQAS